jgi:hypothetical protein
MARRSKATDFLLVILIVAGAILYGLAKAVESIGVVVSLLVVAVGIGLFIWHQANRQKTAQRAEQARRETLLSKYGDEKVIDDIVARRIWLGQSSEQLVDSIGRPEDIDQKVLKTKKREVWKYGHKGGSRYKYRITLENDRVVGWDEKA